MTNKFLNKFKIIFIIFNVMLFVITISGCKQKEKPEEPDEPKIEITNEVSTFKILENTIYETTVYKFKSNVEGPRVAIVGGIHGDELAGWRAALELIKRRDFKGEVLIIPQANILADNLEKRFAGQGNGGVYNGVTYTDLNRSFPGSQDGTITEQICYAIVQTVEAFNPDHVIDLHESRRSATDPNPLLGDLIIYGNSYTSLFAADMAYEFNTKYKLANEVDFGSDTNAPAGSFNNYFGKTYPNGYVFTIETNRQLPLQRRIDQQLQLLEIFFNLI